ncbi:hypothetical protein OAQ62_00980 [bacterium]|nr:hypothetical protein [bacterium]
MKGHLGVVGDSFTCIYDQWNLDDHFSYQLGQHLDMQVSCLGRGGADTVYIHTQMKYAVEKLGVTHLVIWCTTPDRFTFPVDTNPADAESLNGDLTANKIINHTNYTETEYKYDDYDPKFVSDHYTSIDNRMDMNETWKFAYQHYLINLYDPAIMKYHKQVYLENMYYYCERNKIKTVMVDMYPGTIEVMPSEYVTYLNDIPVDLHLPGPKGQITSAGSPNHMDKPGHINLSNFLKSYFI